MPVCTWHTASGTAASLSSLGERRFYSISVLYQKDSSPLSPVIVTYHFSPEISKTRGSSRSKYIQLPWAKTVHTHASATCLSRCFAILFACVCFRLQLANLCIFEYNNVRIIRFPCCLGKHTQGQFLYHVRIHACESFGFQLHSCQK